MDTRITDPQFTVYVEQCKTEAHRIWCYAGLVNDHFEIIENAFEELETPTEIIQWLGEDLDLDPVDPAITAATSVASTDF